MFSNRELLVMRHITRKPISITKLSNKLGIDNNAVAGTIRRINEKCIINKLTWSIGGKGAGRGGKRVWLRGRKKK